MPDITELACKANCPSEMSRSGTLSFAMICAALFGGLVYGVLTDPRAAGGSQSGRVATVGKISENQSLKENFL